MGLFRHAPWGHNRYSHGQRRRGPGLGFVVIIAAAYLLTGGRNMLQSRDKKMRRAEQPKQEAAPGSTGRKTGASLDEIAKQIPKSGAHAAGKEKKAAPQKPAPQSEHFTEFNDAYRAPPAGGAP